MDVLENYTENDKICRVISYLSPSLFSAAVCTTGVQQPSAYLAAALALMSVLLGTAFTAAAAGTTTASSATATAAGTGTGTAAGGGGAVSTVLSAAICTAAGCAMGASLSTALPSPAAVPLPVNNDPIEYTTLHTNAGAEPPCCLLVVVQRAPE